MKEAGTNSPVGALGRVKSGTDHIKCALKNDVTNVGDEPAEERPNVSARKVKFAMDNAGVGQVDLDLSSLGQDPNGSIKLQKVQRRLNGAVQEIERLARDIVAKDLRIRDLESKVWDMDHEYSQEMHKLISALHVCDGRIIDLQTDLALNEKEATTSESLNDMSQKRLLAIIAEKDNRVQELERENQKLRDSKKTLTKHAELSRTPSQPSKELKYLCRLSPQVENLNQEVLPLTRKPKKPTMKGSSTRVASAPANRNKEVTVKPKISVFDRLYTPIKIDKARSTRYALRTRNQTSVSVKARQGTNRDSAK
jgi:chromosome segregation ATPase